MRTTTLKFCVVGDNYDELCQAADSSISKFLNANSEEEDMYEDVSTQPANHSINYELIVSNTTEITDTYEYTADVIARIKDVRQQQ